MYNTCYNLVIIKFLVQIKLQVIEHERDSSVVDPINKDFGRLPN